MIYTYIVRSKISSSESYSVLRTAFTQSREYIRIRPYIASVEHQNNSTGTRYTQGYLLLWDVIHDATRLDSPLRTENLQVLENLLLVLAVMEGEVIGVNLRSVTKDSVGSGGISLLDLV